MIRYFLAKGDRAGSAVITQGLDDCTCSTPPPSVQIATLGMSTYCFACQQEGYIAPRGPRWPGTASNGKQWALSGDINICGCEPSPVFYAERGMSMTFTGEQAAGLAGRSVVRPSRAATSTLNYDEQVRAISAHASLAGYPYYIETESSDASGGRVDSSGLLPRIATSEAERYTVYWGDEALSHEGWK